MSIVNENENPEEKMKLLPDISHQASASVSGKLDKVGMDNIELPVQWEVKSGELSHLPAKISAFVSLDNENAKGIHMSRLYLSLQSALKTGPLTYEMVSSLLDDFVEKQDGLSENSFLAFDFEVPVERKALLSEKTGWRNYRVKMSGSLIQGVKQLGLSVDVVYSSTCPCSAALSRQLISEEFLKQFQGKQTVDVSEIGQWLEKESSIVATPHAQRSLAEVNIEVDPSATVSPLELINEVEKVLGTPVQSAVKRQDEQEFARLNAKNLMFCEDAGRKVKALLDGWRGVLNYNAKLSHHESLHPHDAVCYISKSGGNK